MRSKAMISKRFFWGLFVFFAIGVGLYPLLYWLGMMEGGLLASKTADIRQSTLWQMAFYTHISLGGLSLITGWSQFSAKLRARRMSLHRSLGKVYVLAVLFSGLAGLYIAFYATGGLISQLGFGSLAVLWLGTTFYSYQSIRQGRVSAHQQWMIRSYALCFAAVTLRLWLPLFQFTTPLNFVEAYRIIAWLCWVPNLIFAEWWIRTRLPVAA